MEDKYYENEAILFMKFKGVLTQELQKIGGPLAGGFSSWCLRHDVHVVSEMNEIAPIEAFMIGYRTWERILGEQGKDKQHVLRVLTKAGVELHDKTVDFIALIGDRIPVSYGEDLVYLFPRDLVDKALLFNMMPE